MSILENFPHECTISRMNRGRDALGGSIDTLVPVQTGVKCWQMASTNSEETAFQKRGIADGRKIYFTSDPGVDERFEIKVTKRLDVVQDNPQSYAVVSKATPDASAGLEILWRVMVTLSSGENQ